MVTGHARQWPHALAAALFDLMRLSVSFPRPRIPFLHFLHMDSLGLTSDHVCSSVAVNPAQNSSRGIMGMEEADDVFGSEANGFGGVRTFTSMFSGEWRRCSLSVVVLKPGGEEVKSNPSNSSKTKPPQGV